MFTLVGLSRRHLGKPELRKVERKAQKGDPGLHRKEELEEIKPPRRRKRSTSPMISMIRDLSRSQPS